MNRSRVVGVLVCSVGVGLLSWILIDASNVVPTLGLGGVLSEASVALLGLCLAGACFVSAVVVSRRTPVNANAL
jgi:thiamine monophosphate synthase